MNHPGKAKWIQWGDTRLRDEEPGSSFPRDGRIDPPDDALDWAMREALREVDRIGYSAPPVAPREELARPEPRREPYVTPGSRNLPQVDDTMLAEMEAIMRPLPVPLDKRRARRRR